MIDYEKYEMVSDETDNGDLRNQLETALETDQVYLVHSEIAWFQKVIVDLIQWMKVNNYERKVIKNKFHVNEDYIKYFVVRKQSPDKQRIIIGWFMDLENLKRLVKRAKNILRKHGISNKKIKNLLSNPEKH